jgi:hypothetical protein
MNISPAASLTEESLLDEARRQAGLEDFGDQWFLEPMRKLLAAIDKEADLSRDGAVFQRERMVHGLANRLRLVDALKRHPDILNEEVEVAAVIVGLPRTGSTLFHRMLSQAPGINTIRWWELHFYSPFAGEERGKPVERRRRATEVMDAFVKAGLLPIHPLAIDAPDEEIVIIDQFFVGTGPEAATYVPSFAEWLDGFDHRPVYEDLKTILKFFQWQEPSRRGKRWVLKSPGHLPTLDALGAVFPEARIVSNHRDPLQTVPSFCSMIISLQGMAADNVDEIKVGRFTAQRWTGFLERYAAARERLGPQRFIDIAYADLLDAPVEQARRVLQHLNIEMTAEVEAAMRQWLAENAREKRAPHHYSLEQFGLENAQLQKGFESYRRRFLGKREET